jgi:hypothetical protein
VGLRSECQTCGCAHQATELDADSQVGEVRNRPHRPLSSQKEHRLEAGATACGVLSLVGEWSRGESNPRPETVGRTLLRV